MEVMGWEWVQTLSPLAEAAARIEREAKSLTVLNCYGASVVPPDCFGRDFVTDEKTMPECGIDHVCYMLEVVLKQDKMIDALTKKRIRWCMREIKSRVTRRDKEGAVWLAGQIKKMVTERRC